MNGWLNSFLSILALSLLGNVDCAQAQLSIAASECLIQPQNDKHVVLLSSQNDINHLRGWNHVDHNTSEQPFELINLKNNASAYQVDDAAWRASENCEGEKTLNTVLAAKLSDWTRQHINGIEAVFTEPGQYFSEFDYLEMVFRLDTSTTHTFDDSELDELYPFLTRVERQAWDSHQATLAITLFAEGALDQTSRSLNAFIIISLGSTTKSSNQVENWQRLRVPLSEFEFYFEQHYIRDGTDVSSLNVSPMAGLRITAETTSGNQLRNIMVEKWTAAIEERFKEVGIEISHVALVFADNSNHSE